VVDRGSTVVKVLRYKSEGRWFDPRWCHWNFSLTKIFLIALWPWRRISLQQKWLPGEFPWGKIGRCVRLTTLPPSCDIMKTGNLNFLEPSGPLRACNRTALPLPWLWKEGILRNVGTHYQITRCYSNLPVHPFINLKSHASCIRFKDSIFSFSCQITTKKHSQSHLSLQRHITRSIIYPFRFLLPKTRGSVPSKETNE
jgi:hypothetical protein